MAISKEFIEAAAKDESLEVEAMRAAYDALGEFLKEKGLEDEANQIMDAAVEKVAEAHGFAPADEDELSLDDLEEVSGGKEITVILSREMYRRRETQSEPSTSAHGQSNVTKTRLNRGSYIVHPLH